MSEYDSNLIKVVNPEKFSDLLKDIKEQPYMFLPTVSIRSLKAYLWGYEMAQKHYGIPPTIEQKEFNDFLKWVREKFEVKSTQGWDKIIEFHSQDERAALDLFFKLYDEWRSLKEPKV